MIFQEMESRHRQMEATLADAKLLANRSNVNNDYYLQVSSVLACSLLNLSEVYFRNSFYFFILFSVCFVCDFLNSRQVIVKEKHGMKVLGKLGKYIYK
jgi:hypothetical protein